MELYSKRNDTRFGRRYPTLYRERERDEDSFLSVSARTRLLQQLKYFSKSDKYLERFLLVYDENTTKFSFYEQPFKDLTLTEVGYDISDFINLEKLEFKGEKRHDSKFFDFIELVLIFTKEEMRVEIASRFERIFKEENLSFAIHGFMLVNTGDTGLRSVASLIKETTLRKKIYDYYNQQGTFKPNYELLAKTSAEMVQLIFSSPKSKDKTKQFSEDLCLRIAKQLTEEPNIKKFASLLSETVKNAKELSNQVSDIRHTDRTTIPVDTPNIYKLIAVKNINLVELAILSLPESFVVKQNPEELKKDYLSQYEVNSKAPWTVKKRLVDDINPDEIPF